MFDNYDRPVISMRISITPRCNLNCIYCHHEGIKSGSKYEMTPDEIVRISELCAGYGVRKIKITGGEPLLRKDVTEIVHGISKIEGIEDVSMTTNGTLLEDLAGDLKTAGLNRINVSLDTLRPDVFSMISRGGKLDTVLGGLKRAAEVGLMPVKLNMVVMNGVNEDEIQSILKRYPKGDFVIQLIELMDAEHDREFFSKYFYDLDGVEKGFAERADDVYVRKLMQGRRKYMLNGSEVEVIKPMHNTEFCARCTRIRVTADGKFKPCLMRSDNLVDFLTPMRDGADDGELNSLFREAVLRRKPYFRDG